MVGKLKNGWKPKRVVLIDPGSEGKMVTVDGYHRLAALHAVGKKKAKAWVGTPRPGAGDWRRDVLAMQREVENASGSENEVGKGVRQQGNAYARRDSDEVSGARSRPQNVIQVPISPDSLVGDPPSQYSEEHGVSTLQHFTPLEVTGELPLAAPHVGDPLSPASVPQDASTYYSEDGVSESSTIVPLDLSKTDPRKEASGRNRHRAR